jgi:hypothetical protein
MISFFFDGFGLLILLNSSFQVAMNTPDVRYCRGTDLHGPEPEMISHQQLSKYINSEGLCKINSNEEFIL